MTREERNKAINFLKIYRNEEVYTEECINAHEAAIEALQKEPCGDCVSREETLKALKDEWTEFDSELMDCLIEKVKKLPSVTPQQKVGQWKRISMDKYSEHAKYWYRCDRCGKDNLGNTDYCPNCGQPKVQGV